MTAFAMVISKTPNSQVNESVYGRLVSQLKLPLSNSKSESVCTGFIKATKLWLPHSRTQGFYQDTVSKSWLACIGNPFGEKYQGVMGSDYTRGLLEDYLERGIDAITELSAPFVVVVYDGRDQSVHVVTDRVGLQHIYITELADCFILSTSSLALASAMNVHLNRESVASYFMAGYLMGQGTFFKEIEKIDGAMCVNIKAGKVTRTRYWSPSSEEQQGKPMSDYLDEFVDTFQKAVCRRLDGQGRTSVELTGGMDSRLNLACALASGKAFHAWTIGEPHSSEVVIAEKLKAVESFDHHVFSAAVDLGETFLADLELLTRLTDNEVNCLNLISSPSCNRQSVDLRDSALSGLAGEILRGSYYVFFKGVPNTASRINLNRLIRFKMLHNVCGEPGVFSAKFPSDYQRLIQGLVEKYFIETEGQPLRWRLDKYYFSGAIQRCIGRSCSLNNYFYRQELPYFDNDIVDIAFRTPHQYKKNSRLFKQALQTFHPGYSEVLLENGLPGRPLRLSDYKHVICYYNAFAKKLLGRIGTSLLAKKKFSPDNAGVQSTITSILASDRVLKLMDPQHMASAFLYDSDNLREFVRQSMSNGFKDRTQIGLMLSFELLCRELGSSLKI